MTCIINYNIAFKTQHMYDVSVEVLDSHYRYIYRHQHVTNVQHIYVGGVRRWPMQSCKILKQPILPNPTFNSSTFKFRFIILYFIIPVYLFHCHLKNKSFALGICIV